jgi:hypothetical protein
MFNPIKEKIMSGVQRIMSGYRAGLGAKSLCQSVPPGVEWNHPSNVLFLQAPWTWKPFSRSASNAVPVNWRVYRIPEAAAENRELRRTK